jgi:hypothetical protein
MNRYVIWHLLLVSHCELGLPPSIHPHPYPQKKILDTSLHHTPTSLIGFLLLLSWLKEGWNTSFWVIWLCIQHYIGLKGIVKLLKPFTSNGILNTICYGCFAARSDVSWPPCRYIYRRSKTLKLTISLCLCLLDVTVVGRGSKPTVF